MKKEILTVNSIQIMLSNPPGKDDAVHYYYIQDPNRNVVSETGFLSIPSINKQSDAELMDTVNAAIQSFSKRRKTQPSSFYQTTLF